MLAVVGLLAFQNCAKFGTTGLASQTSGEAVEVARGLVPNARTLPSGLGHLTFHDEFDGRSVDRKAWILGYSFVGVINEELQLYAPDNFEFTGDNALHIRADQRRVSGFDYTSGAMTTYGGFAQAYGYFEMRARVPKGNGFWPAFWLTARDTSWPPEIDILEALGEDTKTSYLTYHWEDEAKEHRSSSFAAKSKVDLSLDYHLYALDWRPGRLSWFVDGVEAKRYEGSNVTSKPMNLILNLALGGTWPKPPDATTKFPGYFDIDWVRVYQYDDLSAPPPLAYDFTRAAADREIVRAGEAITFDIELASAGPSESLKIQAFVANGDVKTAVARTTFDTGPLTAGHWHQRWTVTIPAGTPPGYYRLKLGAFTPAYENLAWHDNAFYFTVK